METVETNPQDRLVEMITREPTRLMRRIARLVRDDFVAEDLAQESLIRALRNITTLRGSDEGIVCKWLDRIAYHVALNHIRDEGNKPINVPFDEQNEKLATPLETELAEDVVQAEVQHELLNIIRNLPAEIRAVFLLRDVEGLSTAKTAEALDINEGLVKWRLHQARKQLRQQLVDSF